MILSRLDPRGRPRQPVVTVSNMAYKTCYQPHPADTGQDVAHAVEATNPNVSVAHEQLHGRYTDEDWPGQGPPCASCSEVIYR
jgi:hypothetical protein